MVMPYADPPNCICYDNTTTTPTADGVRVQVDWTWNPECQVHKEGKADEHTERS